MSVRYLKNEPLNFDEALLKKDRYTFSVLQRILKMNCQLTITDDETFIICLSAKGYPVWVWTVDGISGEKLAEVFKITMQEFPPEEFHYNIKYEAAEYFMAQASDLKLLMNMMTYECLETVAPTLRAAGKAVPCKEKDLDLLVDWLLAFQEETGIDKRPAEEHRAGAAEKIGMKALYFWVDQAGRPVCLCGFRPTPDGLTSLGPVFTPPQERRKHYAENLVHAVTEEVLGRGLTPILYTNADYEASNECYKKVGFKLKGTLCTIGQNL